MTGAQKIQLWRYGALAFFCGLPLLLVALTISNIMEASAAREVAERQQTTLSQIIAQIAKHRTHAMTPEDTASLYLQSASASLARAEIQDKASRLVDGAGGHLVEAQFTSTPEQEEDGTVAVQLTLDIENKGLFNLLYAVETALPLLDATDLNAHKANSQNEGSGGMVASGPLRIELTVQGHFRKGTG